VGYLSTCQNDIHLEVNQMVRKTDVQGSSQHICFPTEWFSSGHEHHWLAFI